MKDKSNRLKSIRKYVSEQKISSQEELLQLLSDEGFILTQATLSRDLKQLKIAKMPDYEGGYIYVLPEESSPLGKTARMKTQEIHFAATGFISIDFCGPFAVVKTKPAFAGGIAAEIDRRSSKNILGTIAGDDTILVIPREGTDRRKLLRTLAEVLPINH
ncbi:MAG: ArgR family transcriptional regulator [Bacteroidales bacterium]|nr:ArgR family transcriptional regulator [Bacteroidales bacterium]